MLGYGGGRCLLQTLYPPFRANCQTLPTCLRLEFTPTGHCVLVIWQTQQLGNQNMSSTRRSPLGCSATSFFCTNCWLQAVSSPGGTPHRPRQLSELKQGLCSGVWGLEVKIFWVGYIHFHSNKIMSVWGNAHCR